MDAKIKEWITSGKRTFKNHNNAMLVAHYIACETKKNMVVGTDYESQLYTVLEADAPELLDTVEDEMDGEIKTFERFINCVTVLPSRRR